MTSGPHPLGASSSLRRGLFSPVEPPVQPAPPSLSSALSQGTSFLPSLQGPARKWEGGCCEGQGIEWGSVKTCIKEAVGVARILAGSALGRLEDFSPALQGHRTGPVCRLCLRIGRQLTSRRWHLVLPVQSAVAGEEKSPSPGPPASSGLARF